MYSVPSTVLKNMTLKKTVNLTVKRRAGQWVNLQYLDI